MLQIRVYYKESKEEELCSRVVLNHLKPRRYMCAWDFEKLLDYVSEELYWEDIEKDSVEEIEIFNKKEQWVQNVRKYK